jgi:hypothetical protein
LWRHDHIESECRFKVVLRDGAHEASAQELADCGSAGRQISFTSQWRIVQKARADQSPECRRPNDHCRANKIDSGNLVLAMLSHVVANDEATIRPANKNWFLQRQLLNNCCDVIGPSIAIHVLLGIERTVRHSMPAQIERDDVEFISQSVLILLDPTEMALRPPVNEENRNSTARTPFANMQLDTGCTFDIVDFHR